MTSNARYISILPSFKSYIFQLLLLLDRLSYISSVNYTTNYVNENFISNLFAHINLLVYDDAGLEIYCSLQFLLQSQIRISICDNVFFNIKNQRLKYVVIQVNAILKWKVSQSLSSTYRHTVWNGSIHFFLNLCMLNWIFCFIYRLFQCWKFIVFFAQIDWLMVKTFLLQKF